MKLKSRHTVSLLFLLTVFAEESNKDFGNDFRNVAEFIFKELKILVSHFFIMIRDFPVHGGLFKKSFQGFVNLYSSTHLAV